MVSFAFYCISIYLLLQRHQPFIATSLAFYYNVINLLLQRHFHCKASSFHFYCLLHITDLNQVLCNLNSIQSGALTDLVA